MRKEITLFSLAFCMFLTNVSTAQEPVVANEASPRAGGFALGFELSDFQKDFGLGGNLTSPYFFNGVMAVRAHGTISWLNAIPGNEQEYTWMPYGSVRLGFVAAIGKVGGHSRFYSEAGGIILFPNEDFSGDVALGGYGLFGFEFFTTKESPVTYFLEAGGMGSSGKAEKALGQPSYANGFMIDVGIRWYPKSN